MYYRKGFWEAGPRILSWLYVFVTTSHPYHRGSHHATENPPFARVGGNADGRSTRLVFLPLLRPHSGSAGDRSLHDDTRGNPGWTNRTRVIKGHRVLHDHTRGNLGWTRRKTMMEGHQGKTRDELIEREWWRNIERYTTYSRKLGMILSNVSDGLIDRLYRTLVIDYHTTYRRRVSLSNISGRWNVCDVRATGIWFDWYLVGEVVWAEL